jgi:DNA-binding response OmpR family regulator
MAITTDGAAATAGKKWVLLVEDDHDVSEVVVDFLEEAGYHARAVANGAAALELIQADPPSLVLTDFQLGDMNGTELRQRVRGLFGASAPPFALMTGMRLSELEDISGTILLKPFDGEHLLGVVAEHCGA